MKFMYGFIAGGLSVSLVIAAVIVFLNKCEISVKKSIKKSDEDVTSDWEDK